MLGGIINQPRPSFSGKNVSVGDGIIANANRTSTGAFNGAHWDILIDVAQDFVGAHKVATVLMV